MGETFRPRVGRAAVAVVALYALLLQAFLAAALPARVAVWAHPGGLCSPAEAERRADPASSDDRPSACGEACCRAAAPSAPPTPAAAALAVRPPFAETSVPPGDVGVRPARADGAVSARGPPTA